MIVCTNHCCIISRVVCGLADEKVAASCWLDIPVGKYIRWGWVNYQNSTCEPWILELSWTLGIGSQPGAACQSCLGHLASRMLGSAAGADSPHVCRHASKLVKVASDPKLQDLVPGAMKWSLDCTKIMSELWGFKSDGTFHAKTLPLGRWRYANLSWRHLVGSLTMKTFGAPWLYHMILHGSLRKFSNIWSTFFHTAGWWSESSCGCCLGQGSPFAAIYT